MLISDNSCSGTASALNLLPHRFFRTLKAMGRILSVTLLLAVSCFAQQSARPASHPGYTAYGATGFAAPPGGLSGTSFGAPSGVVRQGMGYGRGNGAGRGEYGRRQLIAPIYVGVPIYGGYGYGYGDAYGSDYSDAPADAPPVQTSPSVIINQNFVPERANPMVRDVPETPESSDQNGASFQAPGPPPGEPESTDAAAPPSSDDPIIYLIAFRDRSIVAALAYWMEGNTLKYVNMDHTINQASLELVDRDLSRILNQQRSVEFRLPAR